MEWCDSFSGADLAALVIRGVALWLKRTLGAVDDMDDAETRIFKLESPKVVADRPNFLQAFGPSVSVDCVAHR